MKFSNVSRGSLRTNECKKLFISGSIIQNSKIIWFAANDIFGNTFHFFSCDKISIIKLMITKP